MPSDALNVVPLKVSSETLQLLADLRDDTESGNCVGLLVVAYYRGREYIADIAGEARRNLAPTLGIVRALDHKLAEMLVSSGGK